MKITTHHAQRVSLDDRYVAGPVPRAVLECWITRPKLDTLPCPAVQFFRIYEVPAVDALRGLVLLAREDWAIRSLDPTDLPEEEWSAALIGCDWLAENGFQAEADGLRWCVERKQAEAIVWKDLGRMANKGMLPRAEGRGNVEG